MRLIAVILILCACFPVLAFNPVQNAITMASPIVMTNIIRSLAGTNGGTGSSGMNQNITNWGTISTNNLGKQVAVTGTLTATTNGNLVTISNYAAAATSLLITNKTVTNTWVASNITDSNVTALVSWTANGQPCELGWNTALQVHWDGIIDANPQLKTWVEFTDIYNVTTTNLLFDLIPFSGQYLSYHMDNGYPAGGLFRADMAANVDHGTTAGQGLVLARSNTAVTIYAQRIGSTAGITTGGITNVASYVARLFQ